MKQVSVSFQLLPQTDSKQQYAIVDDVLEMIQTTDGIRYLVGPMDTVLEGDWQIIMPLVEKAIDYAHSQGVTTVMSYIKLVSSSEKEACGFLDGVMPAIQKHS